MVLLPPTTRVRDGDFGKGSGWLSVRVMPPGEGSFGAWWLTRTTEPRSAGSAPPHHVIIVGPPERPKTSRVPFVEL